MVEVHQSLCQQAQACHAVAAAAAVATVGVAAIVVVVAAAAAAAATARVMGERRVAPLQPWLRHQQGAERNGQGESRRGCEHVPRADRVMARV